MAYIGKEEKQLSGGSVLVLVTLRDEDGAPVTPASTTGQSVGNSYLGVAADVLTDLQGLLAPTGQTALGSVLAGTTWDGAGALALPIGTEWLYLTPTEPTMFLVNTTGTRSTASACAVLTADQSHQFRAPSSAGSTGYLHYKALTGGTFRVTALGNY